MAYWYSKFGRRLSSFTPHWNDTYSDVANRLGMLLEYSGIEIGKGGPSHRNTFAVSRDTDFSRFEGLSGGFYSCTDHFLDKIAPVIDVLGYEVVYCEWVTNPYYHKRAIVPKDLTNPSTLLAPLRFIRLK